MVNERCWRNRIGFVLGSFWIFGEDDGAQTPSAKQLHGEQTVTVDFAQVELIYVHIFVVVQRESQENVKQIADDGHWNPFFKKNYLSKEDL